MTPSAARIDRLGLVVGWLLLVGVVGYTGYETQQAIARVDATAQEIHATTREVHINSCGAWLGTYQMLNVWAADSLSTKEATRVRERFAADYRAHCSDYTQTFP
jgi:putative copper export protein